MSLLLRPVDRHGHRQRDAFAVVGNYSAISLTEAIGSRSGLRGPDEAQFSFVDIANGEQWTLRFGDSRFPWWVFDKDRRVPQTAVVDYLPLARLAWATADKPIGDIMKVVARFMIVLWARFCWLR